MLKLRYFAEMKNSEIAAALGLSIRTVEDNLRKGREALGQKAGAGSLLGAAALTAMAWRDPPAQLLPSLLQIVECGAAIVSGSAAASVSTSTTASKVASFSTVLASRWGVALACSGVAVVLALSYLVPNRPKDRDVAPSTPAIFCAFLSLITVAGNLIVNYLNRAAPSSGIEVVFYCFSPMCFFLVGALLSKLQAENRELRSWIEEMAAQRSGEELGA